MSRQRPKKEKTFSPPITPMKQKNILTFFLESIILSVIGLSIAFYLGLQQGGLPMALQFLFTASLLAGLELSVSLDNAVVNETILRVMTHFWRIIFLTIGIAIAVFGMRVLFPILIVSFAGKVDFHTAWVIATSRPAEFQLLMEQSHLSIMGFGGAFLLMVALTFFLDQNKETHWLPGIERVLVKLGGVENAAASLGIFLILGVTFMLESQDQYPLLLSALIGFSVHVCIDVLKHFVGGGNIATVAARNGFIGFIYLEILDSSFSFDGVIAAFAITGNFWLIAIGLGIGALFVRSMTVYLVERGSLEQFVFLEPAAFWAIAFLVLVMFTAAAGHHLPGGEITTGLASMFILCTGVISSIVHEKYKKTR